MSGLCPSSAPCNALLKVLHRLSACRTLQMTWSMHTASNRCADGADAVASFSVVVLSIGILVSAGETYCHPCRHKQ